jgi:2-amino-4-hydroxy-6-hydroxymethyldihydropteridine diphosphokinase
MPRPQAGWRYFIALGSNLGNRENSLKEAWKRVSSLCTSARLSHVYETQPLYVEDQPLYLNAVGEGFSSLEPQQMLARLQEIEREFGRDRSVETRRGPRTLDLDILLCGDRIIDTPDLKVPHPLLAERLFVLVPLLELEPGCADPRSGAAYSLARAALEKRAGGSGGVYLHRAPGYTGLSNTEA